MKKWYVILTVIFFTTSTQSCLATSKCMEAAFEKSQVIENVKSTGYTEPFTLEKIGSIKGKCTYFEVYYYSKEFGNSRLTQRLFIFPHRGETFGVYSIPDKPIKTENGTILFQLPENIGNSVNLNVDKLPATIYLDGELYDLVEYKKL